MSYWNRFDISHTNSEMRKREHRISKLGFHATFINEETKFNSTRSFCKYRRYLKQELLYLRIIMEARVTS